MSLDSIKNNFPDISVAFNDVVVSFKQQSTAVQIAVSAAALAAIALLTAGLVKLVSVIRNRNVVLITPEKAEVAKMATESETKFKEIDTKLKNLQTLKVAKDAEVKAQEAEIKSFSENTVKELKEQENKKLKALKDDLKELTEAEAIVKSSFDKAKAALDTVKTEQINFNKDKATDAEKKTAFTALKGAVETVSDNSEFSDDVKATEGKFTTEAKIKESKEQQEKQKAADKLRKENEFSVKNFFVNNKTTLATGAGATFTAYMAGVTVPVALGIAVPVGVVGGFATLCVAGVKSVYNHFSVKS